jgi:hypothetical protein
VHGSARIHNYRTVGRFCRYRTRGLAASFDSELAERATENEFHGKAFNVFRQRFLNRRVIRVKVHSDDELSVLVLLNSDPGNTRVFEQFA